MSVPKSAEKRRKLARQRKRKQEARVRRNGKQRRLPGQSSCLAPGGVGMSEVLRQFVEPFAHVANGEEAYRRLLSLGVLAWNAALTPDAQKQKKMVDDVFRKAMLDEDEELYATGKALVSQLIARKKSYFAEYRRPIFDFVLTDTGDSYHLMVTSAAV